MITLCSDFEDFYLLDAAFMHILCLKAAFSGSALEEEIWAQREDGKICSVIARNGGRLYLASRGSNIEELTQFALTIGFNEIFAEKALALKMGLVPICEFNTLYKIGKGDYSQRSDFPPLKVIYEGLLQGEDKDISLPSFEDFIPDLSHRLRHGSAIAICREFGTALAFFCPEGGIINGIAVEKSHRFTGIGSRLLTELLENLKGDLLVCATEKTSSFYIKNGFTPLGEAVISRRKNETVF